MKKSATIIGLISAMLLLGTAGLAGAEEGERLTLDQAWAVARERNKDILLAKETANYVKARYVQERASALPKVTAIGQTYRTWDDSQKAMSGGAAPLGSSSYLARFNIDQALYTWGQIPAAIRAAEIALTTAEDQLRLYQQAALKDVAGAFYDVLLAKELQAIAAQNMEQRLRHLDEARRKYAAGLATDYDVLAADVAVQNAKPQVIKADNLVSLTRERLGFFLGRESRRPDAVGQLRAEPRPSPAYDQVLGQAYERRPEMDDLRHRLQAQAEVIKVYAAGNKPRLDLHAEVGWAGMKAKSRWADGYDTLLALQISIPIFDGFKTDGLVAQAKSEETTYKLQEAKLRDAVSLQVSTALNDVEEAAEILKGLTGTVAQAEKLLSMAEKGFQHGLKTSLEVQDAELNLTQARGNLAQAQRNYLVARVNLDWVAGVLGEERKL